MNIILHGIKSSKLNFLENAEGNYTAPLQIVILPKSPIVGRDGREFIYNTQEVLDSFVENQADLPIDIEHATELKAPKGEYSGAVGWVKSVQAGIDGEVIANLEWNGSCFDLISKSYKYYSPAFEVDDDNKVIRLTSVGLTNRPNFKVPALNSRQSNSINRIKGGKKLKKLARVLNSKKSRNEKEITEEQLIEEAKDVLDLPEDASINEVIEEIAKVVDEVEELKKDEEGSTSTNAEGDIPASIISALDLPEDATIADVIDAIDKLKGGSSDGGEAETNSKTVKALQSEVKKLTSIINSDRRNALIEKRDRVLNSAIEDGKISPATRRSFELSLNSEEVLNTFIDEMKNAPSVFAKSIKKPEGYNNSGSILNSEQKEWCKRNGVKEKDYAKTQSKILGN